MMYVQQQHPQHQQQQQQQQAAAAAAAVAAAMASYTPSSAPAGSAASAAPHVHPFPVAPHPGFSAPQSWGAVAPMSTLASGGAQRGTVTDAAMTRYYRSQLKAWESRRQHSSTAVREHKTWLHSFKKELGKHTQLGAESGGRSRRSSGAGEAGAGAGARGAKLAWAVGADQ